LLHAVRSIDEALRQEPPRLSQLGDALAELESAHRTPRDRGPLLQLGVEGAERLARLLLARGERRLVEACTTDKNLAWTMAQRLAGDAQGQLDLKHGNYAGTARALDFGFAGDNPLARVVCAISDRELVARLHRLTLECRNHIGDVEGAERARAGFASVFEGSQSLSLLAEALKVENLASVALQNRLPCAPEETDALLPSLSASAGRLSELAARMSQPVLAATWTARADSPSKHATTSRTRRST
jgi:hypothetical protein